jgi:serine/threonine-protein kinase
VTEAGRGLTGKQLGPYRLEAVIGVGAFGYVYRAQHTALNVPRAVKVMQGEIADEPRFRERFLHEAKMAASLSHPNIVTVHDFGVEDGIQYLVMEYVESLTLGEHLNRMPVQGRLGSPMIRQCIADIAAALDYAHSLGIIHRDLKPANVLVRNRDARALLTDFGIARALSDPNLTMTGRSLGTYAYMSPEQCEGSQELTTLTDVYAFAAMLYEITTGTPPFGRGIMAVAGHVNQPLPPVRLAGSHLPEGLDGVLARGMMKRPGDRYGSAGELASAFLALVAPATDNMSDRTVIVDEPRAGWEPQDLSALDFPPAEPEPARGLPLSSRRTLLIAGAAAAAVLGVAAVGAGAVWLLPRLPHPTPTPAPTAPAGLPKPVEGIITRPMVVAGMQLTVLTVDTDAEAHLTSVSVPNGFRLVSVEVQYRNVGRRAAVVSPFDWAVTDSSGLSYTAVASGTASDLPQVELAPGRTVRGVIGFAVPKAARGLVLRFASELGDDSAAVEVS